jgi:hypothetical protein
MKRTATPVLSEELLRDLAEIEERIQAGRRRSPTDEGHVYVIQFSTGVVKVGKAVGPTTRLSHHALQAKIHGVSIAASWTSERHSDHSKTERRLIDYCASRGVRIAAGNEYFTGVSFEDARDFAARLIAAVNGDMRATWEEAQAALDGSA